MADKPADPTTQNADGESGPLNPEEIDALDQQLGESESTARVEPASDAALGEAGMDAPLNAAFETEGPATGGGPSTPREIDAVLAAAVAADASTPAAQTPENELDSSSSSPVAAMAQSPSDEPAPTQLGTAGKGKQKPLPAATTARGADIEPEAAVSADGTPTPQSAKTQRVDLPDFSDEATANGRRDISILRDLDLKVHIELGRTMMYIEDVLKLSQGSVVELDNLAGDPVDVYVNGRLIARGEVLVLSDNFCVRVSEIVSGPQNVGIC